MPPELTAEELKFFETGDITDLGLTPAPAPEPAPAPAPEPAPAPAPAPTSAPEPAPAPVPAPSAAEDLQRILSVEQERRAQLEASITRLQKQIEEATKPPPPAEPDPTKDPLGAMMHKLQRITQEVESLKTGMVQQTQEQAQATQFQQFVQQLQVVRDEFAKQNPDFHDAYKHLRQSRTEDLRDVGVPEAEIQRALLQDELALSQNAIQQGKNPAAVIYGMAKRYGYKPQAAAPAPAAPVDRIAALAKGVASDVAPPKAGAAGELTLDGLKDAGDADLDKLVQDEQTWRRIVGGDSSDIFD